MSPRKDESRVCGLIFLQDDINLEKINVNLIIIERVCSKMVEIF